METSEKRICRHLREAILVVLENRGLVLSSELKERVLTYANLAQLECCLARATIAASADEAIAEGCKDEKPVANGMTTGERLRYAGEIIGRLEGLRESLWTAVRRTGLVLTKDERARILACRSEATLRGWIHNAVGAANPEDIFRISLFN